MNHRNETPQFSFHEVNQTVIVDLIFELKFFIIHLFKMPPKNIIHKFISFALFKKLNLKKKKEIKNSNLHLNDSVSRKSYVVHKYFFKKMKATSSNSFLIHASIHANFNFPVLNFFFNKAKEIISCVTSLFTLLQLLLLTIKLVHGEGFQFD